MSLPLAMLSDWHIIVLAFLVVLLFGGKKLPEVARGLGEAMREFRKAIRPRLLRAGDQIAHYPNDPSCLPQQFVHPSRSAAGNRVSDRAVKHEHCRGVKQRAWRKRVGALGN